MSRSLSRGAAIAMVAGVIALMVWGLASGSHTPPDGSGDQTDGALYMAINDQMAEGDGYYDAAIALQAERGYPTSPAAAVRTPTVSWVIDTVGTMGAAALLATMIIAAMPLLLRRFEQMSITPAERYSAIALVVASAAIYASPAGIWVHEAWALALILLSLAIRSDRRWAAAVVVGVAAPFVRELALVYPAVMLLLAVRRNRREALAWGLGMMAFGAFYAWHISQVTAAQLPHPAQSQGWLRLGGWPFIVDSVQYTTFLGLAPHLALAILTPLALAGWWFVRSPVATPMVLTSLAFIVCFMVIGRPINVYWGILFASLLIPGLAFVPRGTREVWRAITT